MPYPDSDSDTGENIEDKPESLEVKVTEPLSGPGDINMPVTAVGAYIMRIGNTTDNWGKVDPITPYNSTLGALSQYAAEAGIGVKPPL